MHASGFVFAMNRNRDSYQVPMALHEAGVLQEFVTDLYFARPAPRWLPDGIRRRHYPGLSSAGIRRAWRSLLLQYSAELLGLDMHRVFPITDRLLAATAARRARRHDCALYAYSSYVPPAGASPPGKPVVSFEYHPHPALSLDILERDFAQYPEVAESIAQERLEARQNAAAESWQRATHVVCASSMTARSLEFAGCPADRISVIPYGTERPAVDATQRDNAECQFLFVGQGIQRKGLHHLLHAWRTARLQPARLTLVCYRIDPGIAELARQAEADGLNVRVLRAQSRGDLLSLYRGSDVFAMPSLVEGFGLVYLEALGEGCHVIATPNTGIPDLNLPAEAASLTPVGDIEALAETLRLAWERWRGGRLDAQAIAEAGSSRSWQTFRSEIAAHARGVLQGG